MDGLARNSGAPRRSTDLGRRTSLDVTHPPYLTFYPLLQLGMFGVGRLVLCVFHILSFRSVWSVPNDGLAGGMMSFPDTCWLAGAQGSWLERRLPVQRVLQGPRDARAVRCQEFLA